MNTLGLGSDSAERKILNLGTQMEDETTAEHVPHVKEDDPKCNVSYRSLPEGEVGINHSSKEGLLPRK